MSITQKRHRFIAKILSAYTARQYVVTLAMFGFTVTTLNNIWMLSLKNLDSDFMWYSKQPRTSNTTQSIASTLFGNSLFCNISVQSDQEKYESALNDIYSNQFNHECDPELSPNRKYYILSLDDARNNRGFISFIDHEYTAPFALSLFTNRTFVMTTNSDRKQWVYLPQNGNSIPNVCHGRKGRDCIFKPVSNCTMKQIEKIMDFAKRNDNLTVIDYSHSAPDICRKSKHFTPDSFHELTKDYMVIYQRFECNLFWSRGHVMNRGLIETMIQRRNWNISYHEFNALIWSILLRMQDNIKQMVHQIVRDSLIKYKWNSKRHSIGIPIRGSDKCQLSNVNKTFLNAAEMRCFQPNTFLEIAKRVNELTNGTANTLVVTSEDESIMKIIRNLTASGSMRTVFNDGDMMQSCGLVQDIDKETRSDEMEMIKLMLSMLSTMKLQMHSQYYILQRQSNWAHAIWTLSSCIHCQIEGIIGDGNEDDQRYCINLRDANNDKTIFWDHHLLGDKNATEIESECYRRDRFDSD